MANMVNVPGVLDDLLDRARSEYESAALIEFIEKARSTAVELEASSDENYFECVEGIADDLPGALEAVRVFVMRETRSNANTVVNLFKAAELAETLPLVAVKAPRVTEAAMRLAEEVGLEESVIPLLIEEGSGKDGTITKADMEEVIAAMSDILYEGEEG